MPLNYVTFTEFLKVSLPIVSNDQEVVLNHVNEFYVPYHPMFPGLALALNGFLQVEESTVVAFHTHVFPKEEQPTGKVSYAWLDERQWQVISRSTYSLNSDLWGLSSLS